MQRAIVKFPSNDARAAPVRHDQIKRKIFNKKFSVVFKRLPVKRVQNCVTRAVSGSAGALHGGAFAKFCGVAPKGALINFTLFRARKGHAVMLKFIDRFGSFACQIFHSVCIAQPVRAFDGVIHVPLPIVGTHIG